MSTAHGSGAALALILMAACSAEPTSASDTAHLTGTVKSKVLTPKSAVATSSASGLSLVISDKSDTCGVTHAQGATTIALAVPGAPVAPGTFNVTDVTRSDAGSNGASATFRAADQSCKVVVAETATSGSVTIKQVLTELGAAGASHVRGTFTLVFADGDVTGDFDALLCDGDAGVEAAPGTTDDAGVSMGACAP